MKKSKFIPLLLVTILICGILGGFVGTRLAPIVRNPVPTTNGGTGYQFSAWGTIAEVTDEKHGEHTITLVVDDWRNSHLSILPLFRQGDVAVFRILPLTRDWNGDIPILDLKPGNIVHVEAECYPYGFELVLGGVSFTNDAR